MHITKTAKATPKNDALAVGVTSTKRTLEMLCVARSILQIRPSQFLKQKYGSKMHGVGLRDEWPSMPYADRWKEGAYDQELEPGMDFYANSTAATVSYEDFSAANKVQKFFHHQSALLLEGG